MKSSDLWRRLPSVHDLLESPQLKSAVARLNQSMVTQRVTSFLDEVRGEVTQRAEGLPIPSFSELVDRVSRRLLGEGGNDLGTVINATGRFRGGPWLSTPLAEAACDRMLLCSHEFVGQTLEDASPSKDSASRLASRLAGSEDAVAFNSHSGAIRHALTALAAGRTVVVASGEVSTLALNCRLTDLLTSANAQVREVGVADCATLDDYASALTDDAAIFHIANAESRTSPMAHGPTIEELSQLASSHGVPLWVDLGAGPLADLDPIEEVTICSARTAIEAGADWVALRGDGLIGGPACGLLAGKTRAISPMRIHPLFATACADALQINALTATLRLLLDHQRAIFNIPVLSLLSTPLENLRTRAERLAPQILESSIVKAVEVVELAGVIPVVTGLPIRKTTIALQVTPSGDLDVLHDVLKSCPRPVWGLQEQGRLTLDLRTVFPRQDLGLVAAFQQDENSENAVSSTGT